MQPKAVSKFANFTHDGHTAHKVDPSLMPPVRYGTKWLAPLFGSSGAIYMMLGAALVTVLPLTVVAAKRTMDHSNMVCAAPGPRLDKSGPSSVHLAGKYSEPPICNMLGPRRCNCHQTRTFSCVKLPVLRCPC